MPGWVSVAGLAQPAAGLPASGNMTLTNPASLGWLGEGAHRMCGNAGAPLRSRASHVFSDGLMTLAHELDERGGARQRRRRTLPCAHNGARFVLVSVSPDRADDADADDRLADSVRLCDLSQLPPGEVWTRHRFHRLRQLRHAVYRRAVLERHGRRAHVRGHRRSDRIHARPGGRAGSQPEHPRPFDPGPVPVRAHHDGADRGGPALEDHACRLLGPDLVQCARALWADRRHIDIRLAQSCALCADLRRHLAVDPVHDAGVLRRPPGAAARPLPRRRGRRREQPADLFPPDAADAGAVARRHRAVAPDRRLQGVRHRVHPDRRRPRHRHRDAEHAGLQDDVRVLEHRRGLRLRDHRVGRVLRVLQRLLPDRQEAAERVLSNRMSTHRTSILWTTVALAYGALILFPVFWMATMVVKPTDVMFARPTVFLFEPTLAHFDYVIKEGFLHSLVTSFLLCSVSTLLVVLIGTPAAYAFARFEMKAKDDLFLFILATRMAPPVCLVIPFYLIFAKVGLLDTFLGLTIAYHDVQPVVLRLGVAQLLPRSAGRARRGRRAGRVVEAADLSSHHLSAAAQRHHRHRGPVLHLRLERVPVRVHARRQGAADAAGGHSEADHHAGRALGRDGGHRHGCVAAGAGRRGLPATPHRSRTDARRGEGIARGVPGAACSEAQ